MAALVGSSVGSNALGRQSDGTVSGRDAQVGQVRIQRAGHLIRTLDPSLEDHVR